MTSSFTFPRPTTMVDHLEDLYKVHGVDRSVVLDVASPSETPETVRGGGGELRSLFPFPPILRSFFPDPRVHLRDLGGAWFVVHSEPERKVFLLVLMSYVTLFWYSRITRVPGPSFYLCIQVVTSLRMFFTVMKNDESNSLFSRWIGRLWVISNSTCFLGLRLRL